MAHIETTNDGNPSRITLVAPDDWHLHLRDGDQMRSVIGHSSGQFERGIIMPNLKPPVTTVVRALEYRKDILAACEDQGLAFQPLMTLYLTDHTSKEEILMAKASGIIYGCKLYPAGATTNSAAGVTDIGKIYPILEVMQEVGMPLLIHGETTDPDVDIFDREAAFLSETLFSIVFEDFPDLRVVVEHITTIQAVEFLKECGENVAATITPHHLLCNRNDIFTGGINPHYHCMPILKRENHRLALLEAAVSGNSRFFLGTDSAPHSTGSKQSCGCAGCFTAPYAIALYAEAFEQSGHPDWPQRLEKFASFNGPNFYHLPRNVKTIAIVRQDHTVPDHAYPFDRPAEEIISLEKYGSVLAPDPKDYSVIPFYAGKILRWKMETEALPL